MYLKTFYKKKPFPVRGGTLPILLFSFLLYTGSVFFGGAYFNRQNFIGKTLLPAMLTWRATLLRNAVSGLFANPPRLSLDIRWEDFSKLVEKRREALSKGVLISSDNDYVPAAIRYRDQFIKVKLRLKGNWTDHLDDKEKWSYRVSVKGKNTLFGMKNFSLQHPKTRNYVGEWIFHEALKREGILSLKYQFVHVTQNGKNLGIYALEEHFDKFLIERTGRREGPILRFDEELTWANIAHYGNLQNPREVSVSVFPIGVNKEKKIFKKAPFKEDFLQAAGLLERARQKELPYSKVFDVKLFGKYFALLDLLGAQHSASPANFRFYFNPDTGLIEPIGFNGDAGQRISSLMGEDLASNPKDDLNLIEIWRDNALFESYLQELERMSDPAYLDRLFSELEPELKRNLRILHSNYPAYMFSKEAFYENQDYIRKTLNPVKAVHAYFQKMTEQKIEIRLANIRPFPLEITALSYEGIRFPIVRPVVLEPRMSLEKMSFKTVYFEIPKSFVWSEDRVKSLILNYRILGTARERQDPVYPWSHFRDGSLQDDLMRQSPNADEFEFLEVDRPKKEIRIKTGEWNLDRNLIVPAGYWLIAVGGSRLHLSHSAKIISYSPLIFRGSEDHLISIDSPDSTGQGIIVLKAGEDSLLEYVTFKNLSNPAEKNWSVTGAVTFYESPVRITNCQFLDNHSEDSLHIVRSKFTLIDSLFNHSFSDELDTDSAEGRIANTTFIQAGNDAIDVSGTPVTIQDVIIKGTEDKGISAGEDSQVSAERVSIKNAEIGVASKDLSQVDLRDLKIEDSKLGLTVYQKKAEYGPGTMAVSHLQMHNTEKPYLVEEGSSLKVDGDRILPNSKKVKTHLYGVEYGKASH